ncbi:MAG: hypothetical protein M3Q69_22010 [Acidobacteriota bacterium]|nr:hypothetical protein [Acidobacteriota bacterium]
MRLAICVAILGERPEMRDNFCARREKHPQHHHHVRLPIKQQEPAARASAHAPRIDFTRS